MPLKRFRPTVSVRPARLSCAWWLVCMSKLFPIHASRHSNTHTHTHTHTTKHTVTAPPPRSQACRCRCAACRGLAGQVCCRHPKMMIQDMLSLFLSVLSLWLSLSLSLCFSLSCLSVALLSLYFLRALVRLFRITPSQHRAPMLFVSLCFLSYHSSPSHPPPTHLHTLTHTRDILCG